MRPFLLLILIADEITDHRHTPPPNVKAIDLCLCIIRIALTQTNDARKDDVSKCENQKIFKQRI